MKNTIKAHKDFDFGESVPVLTPAFIMKCRHKKYESGQYGIIASKRAFPKAVQRNRARRLLRAWLQQSELPAGLDILAVAKVEVLETTLPDGLKYMKYALKKLDKVVDEKCLNPRLPKEKRKKKKSAPPPEII